MGEPVRKELEFLSHTTRGDSLDICCEQLSNGVDGDQQHKIFPFHRQFQQRHGHDIAMVQHGLAKVMPLSLVGEAGPALLTRVSRVLSHANSLYELLMSGPFKRQGC